MQYFNVILAVPLDLGCTTQISWRAKFVFEISEGESKASTGHVSLAGRVLCMPALDPFHGPPVKNLCRSLLRYIKQTFFPVRLISTLWVSNCRSGCQMRIWIRNEKCHWGFNKICITSSSYRLVSKTALKLKFVEILSLSRERWQPDHALLQLSLIWFDFSWAFL